MRKKWMALLLCLCVLPIVALADWTAEDANLSYYEDQYGEMSEAYKRIRYGDSGDRVGEIKETLAALGFFAGRVSNNYYRTLETAVRIFAGQLRIGGDGQEITPLMQAMLADAKHLPRAISPVIDIFDYSWEPDGKTFTPYTYARVTRTSVKNDVQVGLSGQIVEAARDGSAYYYAVAMEESPEKVVYVRYTPLPQTTVFQPGDVVTLFGTTQGEQALPHDGMEAEALTIHADRMGYAKGK